MVHSVAHIGYGLPLKCPKCPAGTYYGMLKVPGNKATPCPNCGTSLAPTRSRLGVSDPLKGAQSAR